MKEINISNDAAFKLKDAKLLIEAVHGRDFNDSQLIKYLVAYYWGN